MIGVNDGGPAFPGQQDFVEIRGEWNQTWYQGMSLRDLYAGLAMQGMMSYPHTGPATDADWNILSARSFRIADEMLKEREKDG